MTMLSIRSVMNEDVSASNRARLVSLVVALTATSANGLFYAYPIFSTRLASIVGLSRSDVVLLGVISQAGLGVFQYPTTLFVNYLQKHGHSPHSLDKWLSVWCGLLFCLATCGIGAIVFTCESKPTCDLSHETTIGVLGICFMFWGQAAGAAFNSISTLLNWNNMNHPTRKRTQLVLLSCSVGVGAVIVVVLYEFVFKDRCSLSAFLFGLTILYAVVTVMRLLFVKRFDPFDFKMTTAQLQTQNERLTEEFILMDPSPLSLTPQTTTTGAPQSLCTLLKSDVVWLTFLGTFIGLGASGTFLSSLGNLGKDISPSSDITFSLMITFLVLQTVGRMINAVVYGYGDFAFVFAGWHLFCLGGFVSFLASPNSTGAFVSAAMVGTSFGGFHSSFPVITATAFPGLPAIDYPQSIGVAMAVSSLGSIIMGQLATVVYKAAEVHDDEANSGASGFIGMFSFFLAMFILSSLSSLLLGKRILSTRKTQTHVIQSSASSLPLYVNEGTVKEEELENYITPARMDEESNAEVSLVSAVAGDGDQRYETSDV